jgi:putative DNA primase/helicase
VTLSIRETAHQLAAAGISVTPVAPDTGKRPYGYWKLWQQHIATQEQIDTLWADSAERPELGLGVVTGAVSGSLEMVELEEAAMVHLDGIAELAHVSGISHLWERLQAGWVERSPSGGVHWFYRVDGTVPSNTKIASDENKHVLAETRGEGGFVVVAPTPGSFHATGQPWVRVAGGPETIPTITMGEREVLHSLLATLNRAPRRAELAAVPFASDSHATARPDGDVKPGDDFEAKTDWADILTPHGWSLVHTRGRERFWRRPGKTEGISASTGHAGDRDRLYVFTTSTRFDNDVPYTKFGAHALLNHDGDHHAAARELAAQGFGRRPVRSVTALPTQQTTYTSTGIYASVAGNTALKVVTAPDGSGLLETFTDTGNAVLVAARYAHRLKYVADAGRWAAWNGARWVWEADDASAIQAVWDVIKTLPETTDPLTKHKLRSLSTRAVTNVVRFLRAMPQIRLNAEHFDTHPYQVNTPGGVVDVRTGRLTEPDPALFHTKQTGCVYDPDMPTPKWDRFLDTTFQGDQQMIGYVRRLAGLSAIGDVTEHVLPFLYGAGSNGKTVFLETLQAVLGEYATEAPHGFLLSGREKHETELASLQGRRLVVASEINENTRFDEAKMKTLTGGDRITARFMRQDYFTFQPTHTLWLMGNNQPKVTTGGHSFWRRLRLIPFTHTVTDAERIEGLQQQLVAEEGPGILAWIVCGAMEARKEGLKDPPTVLLATAEYASEEDHLARFLTERCHFGGGEVARVEQTEFRRAYAKWCMEEGEDELPAQTFGRRLRARHGVETARSHGRKYYLNVTMYRPESEEEHVHWTNR